MTTQENVWRIAAIAAVVTMVSLVAYDRLAPDPDKVASAKQHRFELKKLEEENKTMLKAISDGRDRVESLLWQADPDAISAEAMASVDQLAKANLVKVQAFRPQRTVSEGGIDRYPYSAVLSGSFPRVLQTVRKLQDPGTKLAVTSVQISAADGETDGVTATIGLAAFSASSKPSNNGK